MATNAFKKEVLALTTDKVFLTTLVLDHPGWRYTNPDFPATLPEGPLRLIDDVIPQIIGADTYSAYGFKFSKHSSKVSGTPKSTLRIEDVDKVLSAYFRTVKTTATATVTVIMANNPTQPEIGPFTYDIDNVQQTGTMMNLTLSRVTILNNRLSGYTFSAEYFPGLFL